MTAIERALALAQDQLGQEVGVSGWITVDQAMIDAFADVSGDDQWIHVDADRAARETPFGGTIAHGFLTLSLGSRFSYECLGAPTGPDMGINYGFNKVRFLSPVPAGARVRGRFVLQNVQKRDDASLLREHRMTIEIEGTDTPALVADWLGLTIFAARDGE